jgi:hypothetical protein
MSARISRTLGLLAVLVMTAAAWPNPVAAQTGASETGANKQHEVNFFLGGLYTQNKLPLNAGFNTGFRYAYKVYQNFWLELETGLTFTNDAETDGLLGHGQLHVRWHPLRSLRPVDPFLLVGAGAAGYNTWLPPRCGRLLADRYAGRIVPQLSGELGSGFLVLIGVSGMPHQRVGPGVVSDA